MCSLKGKMITKRRYNKEFYNYLNLYETKQISPEQELRNFLYAIKDVPAYKTVIDDDFIKQCQSGVPIADLINRFPIINKNIVKEHYKDFLNLNYNLPKFEMRTSGTTGSALVFPYSVDMENRQWAVWWRYRRWHGIDLDSWCGWFGGKEVVPFRVSKPPFWRINYFGHQVMFSTYHLTLETIKGYYQEIKRRKLKWLHGYPSHIAKLGQLILDAGLSPILGVKVITFGAENVLEFQIEKIKKAFPGAELCQHYGLNEGVANISQNNEGKWLVDSDFCNVEFVPLSEKNPNVCRIVGTGFSNLAFPLVRYDTGDLATISKDEEGNVCIQSIDGRSSNVIKLPDGHEITEAALSILLHDFMHVIEAQFFQPALNEVELHLVKGKNYVNEDEIQIKRALQRALGNQIAFRIKYVDKVQRTLAGKLKLVVSELL